MVAGQPIVEPSAPHYHHHNNHLNNNNVDIYPPHHYSEYHQYHHHFPTNQNPGEMCPAHTQLCTLHGDYGPVTVPMVSTNSSPPIAMPVQVPHGHVVQQIVDESGTLRHVILSPQHPPLVPLPPHFGAGSAGGSNPPQPFFPTGLPPGFPAFPHGNPLQQGVLPSHLPPTQQGHSPPPGINFHKDERSQKQYNKLKKKLEQKQMKGENNIMHATPPLSPRKGK
uniref:Uncharacterized protein n=1 Tax=Cacopsylla melanoneura TaxID=428564 RepID=A0A8D8Y009_9HEMI